MEKYSVLMSLYIKEKPKYLKMAIDSMLDQTIKPDEIVVVFDGPLTEELYSTVDEYQATNPGLFNIVRNEKNLGLGRALNNGLRICRNDLVARMDTDDISKPSRCEKQLRRFEQKPDLAILGAWVDEFNSSPNEIVSTRKVPTEFNEIYRFAKKRSAFNHPVVMYRKSEVLKNHGYNDLRRNQDVDLFGRMLFSGCKAENLGEALLFFRSNDDLAKRRKSWENSISYIETIEKFWKMGYSSFGDYITVTIAQIGMFLMPTRLQHWIYTRFLRK